MTSALVVGSGIAGVAAAQVLRAGGLTVRVVDRGRRPGGRLGERSVELPGLVSGRHVIDTGAAYFTVSGDDRGGGADGDGSFAAVADGWAERDLAAPWTDTFALAGPDGLRGTTIGPQRWAATGGLRGLVDDLADGLDVRGSTTVRSVSIVDGRPSVDGEPVDVVVLAMPDPQAGRLLDVEAADALAAARRVLTRPWRPVTAVWAAWGERWWPELDAAFVADEPAISLVADDGRRRGDGAPVLVAHVPAELSGQHLQSPEDLLPVVLDRLGPVLGVPRAPDPVASGVHRWSFANPAEPHEAAYWLSGVGRGLLGVCGDAWGGKPKVEQAWTWGRDLGRAVLERL